MAEAADSGMMDKAEEMAADSGTMDKAEEMAADSGMMDKAEEMAADSGMMDKAEEMAADSGMMDKAEEMATDSGMMDKAEEMVDSSKMKEAMNDAHSISGVGAGDDAVEAAGSAAEEAVSTAMVSVSMEDGTALAKKSGCFACHAIERKVLGPSWNDVAARYADDKAAGKAHLLTKVAKGGKGVWADAGINASMPPYSPRVSDADIETLVDFVLGL